jgi:hypothetical protein
VKVLLLKLKLPVLLTVLALAYGHYFEKPRSLHRRVFSALPTEDQVHRAQDYLDRYYFYMSYVDCGAAFETRGHSNNGKYLIQAMQAIHNCEKAGIPIDRRLLVLDSTDDFLEDFDALKNPKSQVRLLGIDPWERFW